MHGEQGALLCTAKIVETVPWIDAKYYASTQVMDEARHVEVFAKYLDTKLSGHYPINAHLKMLLDDIIADSRWDMTYLGMQIMVEGLALAAFGFMHQLTTEPLLKQLLRYVMSDEARHVAFGVLSLKEYYDELDRRRDARAPGVRLRGRGAHARPLPPAGGVGAHGRRRRRRRSRWCMQAPAAAAVPADAVLARSCRTARSSACSTRDDGWLREQVHRARRHPVRGLGRHRRGVRDVRSWPRARSPAPRADLAAGAPVRDESSAVDGVHDMGGMHGFGPVEIEVDEPVFHEPVGGPHVRH